VPAAIGSHRAWLQPLRRGLAGVRAVIESVTGRLLETWRLEHERPHEVGGRLARLAAQGGLHHACLWLNRRSRRSDLAFADLVDW
jgi:hypothetical protein